VACLVIKENFVKDSLYFVIPAYNEAQVIGEVIENLFENGFKNIVVVNDGSKDHTKEVVSRYQVVLLNHIINRGQGAALRTGIEFASKQDECKYIVTYDADGQHRLEDVESMLKTISSQNLDIILGSRFIKNENENMPLGRWIMLKFATLFLGFVYGLNFTDAHNGLRLFKKECASKILPTIDNFVHASEIPYLIKKNRLNYTEIPVKIKYTNYSIGKGQKTSNFLRVGKYTLLHKLQMIFFDK